MDKSKRESGTGVDLGLWRSGKSQSRAKVLIGMTGWMVAGHRLKKWNSFFVRMGGEPGFGHIESEVSRISKWSSALAS